MSVAGVIQHQVEDDPHVAAMGLVDQAVEVRHGAEDGIDRAVVGDGGADVEPGRRVDRRQPQRVDAERSRWSRWLTMPGRSPIPSPSLSAKLRG
jgi:hypothetical protein